MWCAVTCVVTAQLFASCGASSEGNEPSSSEAGMSSVASGAGGEDGAAGAGAGGGAIGGAGGQDNEAALPCIDEQLTAPEETCRLFGPRAMDECPAATRDDWKGCYNATCAVCSKSVTEYPYYFDWHPCCRANVTCGSNDPIRCHSLCPEPTEREKHPPCFRVGPEL
jgi:hypothetical protein